MREQLDILRRHLRALDLPPDATWSDVKRAYRTLAQVWHPDRFAEGSGIQANAQEKLKEVNAAYHWIAAHRDALGWTADGQARRDVASTAEDASAGAGWRPRAEEPPAAASTLWLWGWAAAAATAVVLLVWVVAASLQQTPTTPRTIAGLEPDTTLRFEVDSEGPGGTEEERPRRPGDAERAAEGPLARADRAPAAGAWPADAAPAAGAGPADRIPANPPRMGAGETSLSVLTAAEWRMVESACEDERAAGGGEAYYDCLRSQLDALPEGAGQPDLSGLSLPERQMLESACALDRRAKGPAAYYDCLWRRWIELTESPGRPDLSELTSDERLIVESACGADRERNGPAAYYECLRNERATLAAGSQRESESL